MRGNNGNQSLKLDDARALTPAVNPVEAMRRQLALALFDSVKPQDVLDMALKLKEMAQGGDLKAMKMYFDLVIGKDNKPAPPLPDQNGLKLIGEALQDLVDEIRISKAERPKSARLPAPASNGNEED